MFLDHGFRDLSKMSFPIFYDFRVAPLSFDFAVFLAIGTAEAQRYGSSSIDLWLIRPHFRRNNEIEDTYAREYDQWKFNNVILKLASFTNNIRNTFIIKGGQFDMPKNKYPQNYDPNNVALKSAHSQIPTNFIHLHQYYKLGFVPNIFVISPVIATSHLTGILVNEDRIERVMPIPADGPSLGVAPSGK